MHDLLWLLLPVAAFSGWYAATGSMRRRRAGSSRAGLGTDYFRGINYLLNEQPDKAIEVFTRALEVDSETVETHLALGNLFRRRGEVDRAIRIHHNLVNRENLAKEERTEALLELGQDYMRAGLLDRAETLFCGLVESDALADRALRKLLDIYEQEHDWDRAIETARRLERENGGSYGPLIAHYQCERSEELRSQGDINGALDIVRQALEVHTLCVRASLLEGRLLAELGDHRAAMLAYKRVEQQDSDFLAEAVEPLLACYDSLGQPAETLDYLGYLMERYGSITVTLALAEVKARDHGQDQAIAFLTQQLRRRPSVRGLHRLIEMSATHMEGQAEDYMLILRDLTDKLLENRPVYRCQHCGFTSKTLYWQCPSCKDWGIMKPIQGVQGE